MLSLGVLALLASAAASHPPAVLAVHAFDSVEKGTAYVGNTYNFNLGVEVQGGVPVSIVGVRARVKPPELTELVPMIGWGCDRFERPVVTVGDDLGKDPDYRVWSIADRALREEDRHCPYLLVRFVPTRLGVFRAADFDIRYRVGDRTYSVRLDYEVVLNVSREGTDPTGP